MILELVGLERSGLLLDDVLGEIQHIPGDLHVLDVVEILLFAAYLVRVAQQRAHQALAERLQRDDVFAVGQHHAPDRDLVHAANGFADHRKGVMTDLAVGYEIIRTDQIADVDIGFRHKFVDLDRVRRFQRDVVEFLLRHLDVGVGVDLVAFHDVFGGDFLAGVGIDLGIFDAMTGLAVDLVEADLFGVRRRRIQGDRAGYERKAQETLPIGAGGHGILPERNRPGNKDITAEPGFKQAKRGISKWR
ncbi:hypothetical protein GALL_487970 [mine drainage metagenome]|uniref:Uncharacterized protein n=1 Tax=mine drainage metagenome TaxID=410659 RepID=A0A1J5PFP4_9ZZZZ